MGNSKPKKKRSKVPPVPETQPPASPRVVGLDRVELRVSKPAESAMLYRTIGFEPRTTHGRSPRVAVGGLELVLKRASSTGDEDRGVVVQLAVDDVDQMRKNITEAGLAPGRLKGLQRGDRSFEWRDPDGYLFRFVGPSRRPDDRPLSDD